ncbi:MAG: NAD-dependent epimerase/dehydratase family protein [Nitrospinaceae bacterium]|nr:NAD-dependent epimerase/dehydratase family protein [Nitrospinaceae bacterium]
MKALVTGGGGFLGGAIARHLHEAHHDVIVVGRHHYPHLPKSLKSAQVDIRDLDALRKTMAGVEAVFHTAAFAGIWGKAEDFYSINVEGTRNIIKACRLNGVQKLIFTSSPSVVYGTSSLKGVDESVSYPNDYLCEYPRTKAIAEKMVIEANNADLATVSLRPHLIWGPGDPHLIPRLLAKAEKGSLLQVGQGDNEVDIIYIDNAVQAHIKACESLDIDNRSRGKVYFVSDGEPVNLWQWIGEVLQKSGRPPVTKNISYQTASRLGGFLEGLYGLLNIKQEPPMTRFLASQLATSHYFNISRAKKDLGYMPLVSSAEGMNRLIAYLSGSPEY